MSEVRMIEATQPASAGAGAATRTPTSAHGIDSAYQHMLEPLRRLFAVAVMLIIGGAAAYSVWAWSEARRDQLGELRHLSEIIARSTSQLFDSYLLSLQWFAPQLAKPLAEGRTADVGDLLRRYKAGDANIAGVVVLSAEGDVIATTLTQDSVHQGFNVARRVPGASDGFSEMLTGAGPMVTRTVRPPMLQSWAIPVRYPVRDDAGRLRYVVSVLLSVERLGNIWQALSAPPGTVYLLLRPDGHRQLRVPGPANPDTFYGKPANNSVTARLRDFPDQHSGDYEITRASDTSAVIGAYTRLANYPMAAAVSMPIGEIWSAWTRRVTVPLLIMFALLLGVIVAHANARSLQARINQGARSVLSRMRQTEDRLKLALDGADLALWDWNHGSENIYMSERWSAMLGGKAEVTYTTARDLLALVHPDDIDVIKSRLHAVLKDPDATYRAEHRVRRYDGSWIWVESQGRVFERDAEGRATRMAGTNADITERKRAESRAHETQTLLHSIFENIPDMIFVKEARDLRFVSFNRAGEELLGYRRDDLIGKSDLDFFPPEQAAAFIAKDREVLAGRSVVEIVEEPVTTRDRGIRYLHTKKIAIVDEYGNPSYLLGIASDITARKASEQALRESEERFRAAFDQAAVGMGIRAVDPRNSRWLRVNQKLCDLLGYSEQELLRMTTLDITPAEDVDATIRGQEMLASGARSYVEREKWLRRKDGSLIWGHVSSAAIRGGGGLPVYCLSTIQDFTDRKQLEADRIERDREQRRAFVREIHHRIKNHIQGVAGLLASHARREPALAPRIQAAVAQLQAVAVVHGLQGGREGRPTLEQMVPAICASVGGYGDGRIKVEYQSLVHGDHWVNPDEAVPLALIVNELIINAVKHTPRTSVPGTVWVRLEEMDDGVCISVTNPGRMPGTLPATSGAARGEGLRIVRSLLPSEGVRFDIGNRDERVRASLHLRAPVIQTSGEDDAGSAHE